MPPGDPPQKIAVPLGPYVVTNLAPNTTSDHLKAYFHSHVGKVVHAVVETKNGVSRGFGFITFDKDATMNTNLLAAEHVIAGRKVVMKLVANELFPPISVTGRYFVGGLSLKTTTDSLRNYFERYFGEVLEAEVATTEEGLSRGYAFFAFVEPSVVPDDFLSLNHVIDGTKVGVQVPKDQGTGKPSWMHTGPKMDSQPLVVVNDKDPDVVPSLRKAWQRAVMQEGYLEQRLNQSTSAQQRLAQELMTTMNSLRMSEVSRRNLEKEFQKMRKALHTQAQYSAAKLQQTTAMGEDTLNDLKTAVAKAKEADNSQHKAWETVDKCQEELRLAIEDIDRLVLQREDLHEQLALAKEELHASKEAHQSLVSVQQMTKEKLEESQEDVARVAEEVKEVKKQLQQTQLKLSEAEARCQQSKELTASQGHMEFEVAQAADLLRNVRYLLVQWEEHPTLSSSERDLINGFWDEQHGLRMQEKHVEKLRSELSECCQPWQQKVKAVHEAIRCAYDNAHKLPQPDDLPSAPRTSKVLLIENHPPPSSTSEDLPQKRPKTEGIKPEKNVI